MSTSLCTSYVVLIRVHKWVPIKNYTRLAYFAWFCIFLRHLWRVQFIIYVGWGDACVRSGLERREPRNGENWRCRSNSRCGGIFEKLQATADPGALTRSQQKTLQVQKPSLSGDIQGETFESTTLFTAIHFKCKGVKEVASLVESPLASCHVVWLRVHVSLVGFSK